MLALAAQFGGDFASAAGRERLGRGVAPRELLPVMAEVWFVDTLLSLAGLLAAYATVVQDYAYLLLVPPATLLAALSRERRERIANAIELSAAYRGTALLLGDVLSDDDEYTGMHSQGVAQLALRSPRSWASGRSSAGSSSSGRCCTTSARSSRRRRSSTSAVP